MKRLILLALLVVAGVVYGQSFRTIQGLGTLRVVSSTGTPANIIGAEVETNGWVLKVWLSNMDTNGTFNFGLGTNNSLQGTQKLALTVTSLAFDDSANSTTVSRTIYGTKQLRLPYPNEAFSDALAVGTNCVVRIALSDYVFSNCTSLSLSVLAGFYSTNFSGTMNVTNNSTMAYPRVLGNWSWPGLNVITSNTMPLSCVVGNVFGTPQRPVRFVKFLAFDEHGNSSTITVYSNSVSSLDAVPVHEYSGLLDISTFTNGDFIRCDFKAVPFVGNSESILDTTNSPNTQPTPLYASITNLCNRTGAYGGCSALVAGDGNDGTGAVVSNAFWNESSPPAAYATMGAAMTAIRNTNSAWFSRSDLGNSVLYMKNGTYTYSQGFTSPSSMPRTWFQVRNFTTNAAVIVNGAANVDRCNVIKISGVEMQTTAFAFAWEQNVWIDECNLNSSASAIIYGSTNLFFTRNKIAAWGQGLQVHPASGFQTACSLIRGNWFYGSVNSIFYTAIGNATTNVCLWSDAHPAGSPAGDNVIFNDNKVFKFNCAGNTALSMFSTSTTNGGQMVRNWFECSDNTSTISPIVDCSNDSSTPIMNVLVWSNVFVGARCNFAYNSTGADPKTRTLWSFKGNCFDDYNIKADTFITANGARIGNWPVLYGVGSYGNAMPETYGMGASGAFIPEFAGLNTISSTGGTVGRGWWGFETPLAFDGTNNGTGFGSYLLTNGSPALIITNSGKL